ncbi:MAG TPA: hypothetical protein VLV50_04625 [Stellaceae bacterium]|nr:hypothetical protein [Stellaceae bacterium]
MRRLPREHDEKLPRDDEEEENARETRGLAALAFVLILALAASYLVERLRQEGMIEDCLLAGRSNCDALLDER